MLESTMNQIGNCKNPNQGFYKKVLCVCSAGLLRSPTLANVLNYNFDYNTRACGSEISFALVPISEALIHWADEIVFTSHDAYAYAHKTAKELMDNLGTKVIILDIPDKYPYYDSELKRICLEQYINYAGRKENESV